MFLDRRQWPMIQQQMLNQSLGLLPNVIDTTSSGSGTRTGFGLSATYGGKG
jgi:hypothetical protein